MPSASSRLAPASGPNACAVTCRTYMSTHPQIRVALVKRPQAGDQHAPAVVLVELGGGQDVAYELPAHGRLPREPLEVVRPADDAEADHPGLDVLRSHQRVRADINVGTDLAG